MTATILKRKTSIYLLFVILTLGFAYASFYLFEEDLVVRTIPQVKRAMVQVSRLLPQLEENEEAVREVYDDLEEKRRQFIENNEEDLGEQRIGTKSAEKIIDQTLSWMNRVTKLRVGRQGHVVVVSQNDYTILAHPNESYIGQPMYTVNDIDLDKVIDISEIGSKEISDDFHLFFPASFFERRISLENIEETADAGIYGAVFTYKDTYILCGTTLMEILVYVILRSFFTTLFFFSITWVFVRYIGFLLLWMKDSRREFRSKLVCYGALGITVLFVTTWYYQTMMDMTGDIATMNDHAKVAVETLNTYRKYRDSLSAWLDKQYLEQCYLAADMVKARGKDDLSRQDIAGIAQELGVEYIYVFDKTGKTIVTNSPFDSFELSNNKADQSYAFRPLLGGRPYVIQEPQEDEASGEMMQYIGVSLRDEDDLADGFVQIAVNPGLRNRLLSPIHVQTVLDNLVIGLPDYALAVDKETMKIVATTGLGYKKASIEELGINMENLKKDFNGIFVIEGYTYYAGVSESEDLFLMPLVRSTENKSSLLISFKLALLCAAAFILFIIAA